jgi:hypothetical protein
MRQIILYPGEDNYWVAPSWSLGGSNESCCSLFIQLACFVYNVDHSWNEEVRGPKSFI